MSQRINHFGVAGMLSVAVAMCNPALSIAGPAAPEPDGSCSSKYCGDSQMVAIARRAPSQILSSCDRGNQQDCEDYAYAVSYGIFEEDLPKWSSSAALSAMTRLCNASTPSIINEPCQARSRIESYLVSRSAPAITKPEQCLATGNFADGLEGTGQRYEDDNGRLTEKMTQAYSYGYQNQCKRTVVIDCEEPFGSRSIIQLSPGEVIFSRQCATWKLSWK